MKHALVTGGAGFIGSHLVDRLLEEAWNVTVVDNFNEFYAPSIKESNIAGHLLNPSFRLIREDVRNYARLVDQLTDNYDVVVHLAALAGVRPSIADPRSYEDVNVLGTQSVLEFARARRIRQFVFASSSSVYGVNENTPWSEDDLVLLPISPYAATKVAGELLGHVYSHLNSIRFIGLRFFTVYGPRQRPDLAIHKFARLMVAREPVPVYGDGSARRDFTYVSDVVEGIRRAMDYTDSNYEIVNLGNDDTVSLTDVIRTLEVTLGTKAIIQYLPAQPGDVPATWASLKKAERLFGYRPSTSFREGIESFAAWLGTSTGSNRGGGSGGR